MKKISRGWELFRAISLFIFLSFLSLFIFDTILLILIKRSVFAGYPNSYSFVVTCLVFFIMIPRMQQLTLFRMPLLLQAHGLWQNTGYLALFIIAAFLLKTLLIAFSLPKMEILIGLNDWGFYASIFIRDAATILMIYFFEESVLRGLILTRLWKPRSRIIKAIKYYLFKRFQKRKQALTIYLLICILLSSIVHSTFSCLVVYSFSNFPEAFCMNLAYASIYIFHRNIWTTIGARFGWENFNFYGDYLHQVHFIAGPTSDQVSMIWLFSMGFLLLVSVIYFILIAKKIELRDNFLSSFSIREKQGNKKKEAIVT